MYITDIRDRYNNGYYDAVQNEEYKDKLPDNYVINEDKSVKWNREKVAEHNRMVDFKKKEYKDEKIKKDRQFTEDILQYIREEYRLNGEQAILIEQEVYSDYHSCMSDYFIKIDEVAGFVQSVMKAQ